MQRGNWFNWGASRLSAISTLLLISFCLLPRAALAVPGTVTGVTATVVSSQQINLSWTAVATATLYNIYRCSGSSSCTPATTVYATSTTTSFSNTGLLSSTIYRYRLKAVDAGGGVSASYSSIMSGTTLAVAAPTAPATAVISSAQINVSWTASTGVVTGYKLERCSGSSTCTTFAQIAAPTASPFSNTGLTSGTIYRYRVRATDAANNNSAYSAIVTATTPAVAAPTGLSTSVISSAQINLSWTASTGVVSGYQVERCTGTSCTPAPPAIATPTTNSYSNTGLLSSTTYRYRVRAIDAASNVSAYTTVVSGATPAVAAPTGLAAAVISSAQINLSWTASTGAVSGYQVERCTPSVCTPAPPAIASPAANSYSNTGLVSSTGYSFRIRAFDAANNFSAYTTVTSATTPAVAAPTGLAAAVISSSQINLSWTASTGAVSGYQVEWCTPSVCTPAPPAIGTPSATSFNNTGLAASTGYSYRIRAFDAANNVSAYSAVVSATTNAPPDTTPPSAPTGLTAAVVSSVQINLSWTASTDNVGVTGYQLERCTGTSCMPAPPAIANPTGNSYSNTGLSASTGYSYRVLAVDAANNLSAYSSIVSVTTSASSSGYTYDTNGRLSTVTTGGTTVTYTYDAAGNVTSIQTAP
jgi:YD repeat-containing protein